MPMEHVLKKKIDSSWFLEKKKRKLSVWIKKGEEKIRHNIWRYRKNTSMILWWNFIFESLHTYSIILP